MTLREKNLLKILIAISIMIFFFVTFQYSVLQIREYNLSIAKYNGKIVELEKRARSSREETVDNTKINKSSAKSTAEIADIIVTELKESGIVPLRYQILNDNMGNYIEVSIKCNGARISEYFRQMQKFSHPYTIANVNLKNDAEEIRATIRFMLLPSENKFIDNANDIPVERLFILRNKKLAKPSSKNNIAETKNEIIQNGDAEYTIIGKVKESDGIYYLYLKNNDSNRIIKVSPDNVLSETSDTYILKIDNKKISIQKEN